MLLLVELDGHLCRDNASSRAAVRPCIRISNAFGQLASDCDVFATTAAKNKTCFMIFLLSSHDFNCVNRRRNNLSVHKTGRSSVCSGAGGKAGLGSDRDAQADEVGPIRRVFVPGSAVVLGWGRGTVATIAVIVVAVAVSVSLLACG